MHKCLKILLAAVRQRLKIDHDSRLVLSSRILLDLARKARTCWSTGKHLQKSWWAPARDIIIVVQHRHHGQLDVSFPQTLQKIFELCLAIFFERSEERRVGKGCSSRW